MTYKNHEGYPDPTQGEAVNGVRREERQRFLEKKHGLRCGQKVETFEPYGSGEQHQSEQKRRKSYIVRKLYPHCILLEDKKGQKICPSYAKLRELMRNA